jgi:hypothetical protein
MRKLINDRDESENQAPAIVFTPVNGVTYLCCNYCGNPMTRSNVYMWQENNDGKPRYAYLLHYNCQEAFENMHQKGLWFSKGMPSVALTLSKPKLV